MDKVTQESIIPYVNALKNENDDIKLDDIQKEIVKLLKSIIKPKQLECMYLYYCNEESMIDIGKQLGVSRQAVYNNIANGRGMVYKFVNFAKVLKSKIQVSFLQ